MLKQYNEVGAFWCLDAGAVKEGDCPGCLLHNGLLSWFC